jgi:hypothetical protein
VLKEQLKRNAPSRRSRLGRLLAWATGNSAVPRTAFDAIVVETTGIAQPSPIIQLFFADPTVRRLTRLDAVIGGGLGFGQR